MKVLCDRKRFLFMLANEYRFYAGCLHMYAEYLLMHENRVKTLELEREECTELV